jgi:iron complex outermembrane receptor protein
MKKEFLIAALFCGSLSAYSQENDSIRQVELSEIVVSSTRANYTTPTTFTDINALKAKNVAVSPEIPNAVNFSTSVVMTSENGAAIGNQSIRVRGSDISRINVTFDGVPINDGESQSVIWANMPDLLSSLQSIQIQRGVGTSANGAAAFGATLNMQTALPQIQPYGQVNISYGSFNTLKLNATLGTGRSRKGWNADFRYSLGRTDGYIEHSGAEQQSLFFTGGYSSSQRMVKMNVFHGDQHTDISWEGVPEEEYAANRSYNPSGLYVNDDGQLVRFDKQTDNYKQTHVHLHYIERISENIKLNTTLYYTRGKGYYEEYKENVKFSRYGIPVYNEGNTVISATNLIRRKWLDNHLFGAIITLKYSSKTTNALLGLSGNIFDNDHYGKIIWAKYQQTIPANYEWYRNKGKKPDVSAYIKVTQQLGRRWYAFGDIQWRHIKYDMSGPDDDLADLTQKHNYHFVNPKAGLTFVIDPQQRAYASFSVGHREPTRSDIKDALKYGGSTIPKPETLYDVETGYELSNAYCSVSANFFYMYYIDQLVNTGKLSEVGYPLMENVPASYRTGIELTAGIRPIKKLSINGNIVFSKNKIKDYVAYLDATAADGSLLPQREEHLGTTDIAFSPDWVGAADISYEIIKGLSINLLAKYVGKQYYDNTSNQGRQLDGYFVNNLIAQYQLDFKKFYIGFQFSVNNLWNTDYISNAAVYRGYSDGEEWVARYYFPQAFRNYLAKLTVGF